MMARPPQQNSKIPQIIVRGKDESDAVTIKNFKELCGRDGYVMKDVLVDKMRQFLQEHHYPPGNPQTQLLIQSSVKADHECYCGKKASHEVEAVNGWRGYLCPLHHERDRTARLLKRSKRL